MVTVNFLDRGINLAGKQIQRQAPSEQIEYTVAMAPWVTTVHASAPVAPSILKVVDIEDPDTDVSGTVVAAGSLTIATASITLPLIKSLTLGKTYRVHVNFGDGTSKYEAIFLIACKHY
ncbi:hypothetical protein CL634_01915 [bacterium]|nr:hypothetical protein [bacterium]|tara:strand:- start:3166 stop:3522 length:357 start_codon:yes stop_codon:yes gene_type:complete